MNNSPLMMMPPNRMIDVTRAPRQQKSGTQGEEAPAGLNGAPAALLPPKIEATAVPAMLPPPPPVPTTAMDAFTPPPMLLPALAPAPSTATASPQLDLDTSTAANSAAGTQPRRPFEGVAEALCVLGLDDIRTGTIQRAIKAMALTKPHTEIVSDASRA
jgi:hypothetical protein